MIDFKQLLKDNPRFNKFDSIPGLIQTMEEQLSEDIKKNPDSECWRRIYKEPKSKEYLKEIYDHIKKEYVEKGKTQMCVSWSDEYDGPGSYSAAYIDFSISRSNFK